MKTTDVVQHETGHRQRLVIVSLSIALALAGALFILSPASASVDTQVQTARDTLANCQVLAAHSTGTQHTRAQQCVADQTAILKLLLGSPTPGSTTPAPTTPAPTTAPPTIPPPTTAPPTTAPVPVPTTAPPTSPPPFVWPNANTTGVPAGTTLRVVQGDMTLTANAEGLDVHGCVTIAATGVTLSKSRIQCATSSSALSIAASVANVTIEDVEVNCLNSPGSGIDGALFIARRVNVSGCENGVFFLQGGGILEQSYIHDLYEQANPLGHTDGVQLWDGVSSVTVRGNTISNRTPNATSAIITDGPNMSDIIVDHNLFDAFGIPLRCPTSGNRNQITDNVWQAPFTPGYPRWVNCELAAVVSGNQLN